MRIRIYGDGKISLLLGSSGLSGFRRKDQNPSFTSTNKEMLLELLMEEFKLVVGGKNQFENPCLNVGSILGISYRPGIGNNEKTRKLSA